ncbi:MAG: hypothetical protein AB1Z31_01955 [Desulfobacterales bacterium]
MKPKANGKKLSPSLPNLPQIILKILVIYLISAVAVLAICFIFGWRSLENIGTGFIYGSLGLSLFGALLMAGNTVPAQLSKLSLPSVRRHQEYDSDGSPSTDEGRRFFITTLICGAFLFVTGLILKML